MFLPVAFVADWTRIHERKRKRMEESNLKENKRRIPYEYKQGDKVLLTTPGIIPKMRAPRNGPYKVVEVHNNGTATITDGHVERLVNIRRLTPYWTRR